MFISFIFIYNSLRDFSDSYLILNNKTLFVNFLSKTIFSTILFIIILDVLYQNGVFSYFKNTYLNENYDQALTIFIILIFAVYIGFYFLFNKISMSIVNLLPEIKSFSKTRKLSKVIIDFILLVLFLSMIFASINYLLYFVFNSKGFSEGSLNFGDFTFYSFSILFNSPISDIKPTFFVTKIFACLESICSFLLLVILITFILNKYLSSKYKK